MRKLTCMLAPAAMVFAFIVPASSHQELSSRQEVVHKARDTCYNLARQGFNGYKATIEPNWEVILGHTATPQNLKVFRALRFSMTVDARGAANVTHEVNTTEKVKLEPHVNQIHYHVQRLVAGFFNTWAMFIISSPFPETQNQIRIEDSDKEYRLFYNLHSADVMLTMTRDFVITEWRLTGPTAKRTIRPVFQKVAEGLILRGYRSTSEPISGGTKSTLDVNIEYQDLSGMKLPHKVRISGTHGDEPVEAELVFNQYALNPQ